MPFAIRATHRVLRRTGVRAAKDAPPATTALGDWYVNLLYVGQTQLVLCTSEKSLLSVVLPARRLKAELHVRLREAVEGLLSQLKVPDGQVRQELAEMEAFAMAPTASRIVLGSMNDFAALASSMGLAGTAAVWQGGS